MEGRRDRRPRIRRLGEDHESDVGDRSPAQKLAMVWELTLNAWAFKGLEDEPRLRRDVVRVVRRGR